MARSEGLKGPVSCIQFYICGAHLYLGLPCHPLCLLFCPQVRKVSIAKLTHNTKAVISFVYRAQGLGAGGPKLPLEPPRPLSKSLSALAKYTAAQLGGSARVTPSET